jgi:hypothetical protein
MGKALFGLEPTTHSAAGMLEAERRFRRVIGHGDLAKLAKRGRTACSDHVA